MGDVRKIKRTKAKKDKSESVVDAFQFLLTPHRTDFTVAHGVVSGSP